MAAAAECHPKSLHRKARRGELKDFTGIDSAYTPPNNRNCASMPRNAHRMQRPIS
ncbi:MAG: adenylyl-sulfate kinase [Sterolibacterium sp.]|nr:adenylyl-sulfate kinase [Sterolibacterium sp.]